MLTRIWRGDGRALTPYLRRPEKLRDRDDRTDVTLVSQGAMEERRREGQEEGGENTCTNTHTHTYTSLPPRAD